MANKIITYQAQLLNPIDTDDQHSVCVALEPRSADHYADCEAYIRDVILDLHKHYQTISPASWMPDTAHYMIAAIRQSDLIGIYIDSNDSKLITIRKDGQWHYGIDQDTMNTPVPRMTTWPPK